MGMLFNNKKGRFTLIRASSVANLESIKAYPCLCPHVDSKLPGWWWCRAGGVGGGRGGTNGPWVANESILGSLLGSTGPDAPFVSQAQNQAVGL
jgi:hypothetical protein